MILIYLNDFIDVDVDSEVVLWLCQNILACCSNICGMLGTGVPPLALQTSQQACIKVNLCSYLFNFVFYS